MAFPHRGPGRRRGPALSRVVPGVLLPAALIFWLEASHAPEAGARLQNAFRTPVAAAKAVVDALASRDRARLASLVVGEVEFRRFIWPRLPAARPEMHTPVDYVWADTSAKSRGYLGQLFAEFGGRRLDVQSVRFLGPVTDYGPFRIHAKAMVRVKEGGAETREERLFGSLIESEDGWKVFSFIVD